MGKGYAKIPYGSKNTWQWPGGCASVREGHYGLDGFDITAGAIGDYIVKSDKDQPGDGGAWGFQPIPPVRGWGGDWILRAPAAPAVLPPAAPVDDTITEDDMVCECHEFNMESTLLQIGPLHWRITLDAIPSGIEGCLQFNDTLYFGPEGANMYHSPGLDANGNLYAGQGIVGASGAVSLTGDTKCSAFCPSVGPTVPVDSVYGSTPWGPGVLGYQTALRNLKIRTGGQTQETNPALGYNQAQLLPYGSAPGGYGFPSRNQNILWYGPNQPENCLNAIIFRWKQSVEEPLNPYFLLYPASIWGAGPPLTGPVGVFPPNAGVVGPIPPGSVNKFLVPKCVTNNTSIPPALQSCFYDPMSMRVYNKTNWAFDPGTPYSGFGRNNIPGSGPGAEQPGGGGFLKITAEMKTLVFTPFYTPIGWSPLANWNQAPPYWQTCKMYLECQDYVTHEALWRQVICEGTQQVTAQGYYNWTGGSIPVSGGYPMNTDQWSYYSNETIIPCALFTEGAPPSTGISEPGGTFNKPWHSGNKMVIYIESGPLGDVELTSGTFQPIYPTTEAMFRERSQYIAVDDVQVVVEFMALC